MPIRVQIWKGEIQIGGDHIVDDYNITNASSPKVDKMVDLFITQIHDGCFGEGSFTIECDYITHGSATFLGSYYRCETTFPRQPPIETAPP